MAEPVKKDDALATAMREAFQRHMENARAAAQSGAATPAAAKPAPASPSPVPSTSVRLVAAPPAPDTTAERPSSLAVPKPAPAAPAPQAVAIAPKTPVAGREALHRPLSERLAPPSPANDLEFLKPDALLRDSRVEERSTPSALRSRERPSDIDERLARRVAEQSRARPNAYFGATRNADAGKGRSSRARRSALRLTLITLATVVCIAAISGGTYVYIERPAVLTNLFKLLPGVPASAPVKPQASATPVPTPTTAPSSSVASASLPIPPVVATKVVHTTTITLDAVDIAIQDARERTAQGDVASARLILEQYRAAGDPRALFALAETYDPTIATTPGAADPKEAQALYQAAAKAGYQGTDERLAKLQLSNSN